MDDACLCWPVRSESRRHFFCRWEHRRRDPAEPSKKYQLLENPTPTSFASEADLRHALS